MENKMTAIEWLIDKVEDHFCLLPVDLIEQAKAMEKEQIKDAYKSGCVDEMWELNNTENEEHYYNKTYGN